MTSKELREKRAQLVNQARELINKAEQENRDLIAEETKQWDAMNAEITNLGARIERQDSLDKLSRDMTSIANDVDDDRRRNPGSAIGALPADGDLLAKMSQVEMRALSVQGWFLRNSADDDVREQYTEVHRAAQKKTGIGRNSSLLTIPLACANRSGLASIQDYDRLRAAMRMGLVWNAQEQRYQNINPLTTQVAAGGGALIPEGFAQQFETALLAFGYMLQVCEVMRTEGANPLPWPTANDTTNKGRMLTQNAQVDNTGASTKYPTFGAVPFYAYKCTSDEVLVPFELIRDNAVGLVAWLGEALGIRIGRTLNDQATNGTGAGNPTGLITALLALASNAGIVTSAKVNTLQYDDVIELEYQVDPAYRLNNPAAGYMCHDAIIKYLRKLKDGEGRYLWQPSANAGEPDRLNNRPLARNQSMSNAVATGNNVLTFGDHKKMKIRQVGDIRMYRLVERYRDNDQDAFLAFHEFDSNLIDAGTHPIKCLQIS